MGNRRSYNTKQRTLLVACLEAFSDRYLTVREIEAQMDAEGVHVGSTTLYRNLEQMVERDEVVKFTGTDGQARYCRAPKKSCGQLVCLDCGRVQLLDCGMLTDFSDHVRRDHGFQMELGKAMLLGHCADCLAPATMEG